MWYRSLFSSRIRLSHFVLTSANLCRRLHCIKSISWAWWLGEAMASSCTGLRKWFNVFGFRYLKGNKRGIHGKFNDLIQIEQQKLLKSESNPKERVSSYDTSFSLKLPPCDTELFHGGYDKSPRDMFTAIYTKHPSVPSTCKNKRRS